jgi:hypothetical protein
LIFKQSNSGAACTCVVTEYLYHNSADFAIEVDVFSLDEITEQITELLRSYRQYHLHHMEMEKDDRTDMEEKAKIALDTFRSMFRRKLRNEQFLSDDLEDSVLNELRSLAQRIRPSAISGRKVRPTLEHCSALLVRLTSEDNSTQEPAVWPYVRKIKLVWPVF